MNLPQIVLLIFVSINIGMDLFRGIDYGNTDHFWSVANRVTILLILWWGGFFS